MGKRRQLPECDIFGRFDVVAGKRPPNFGMQGASEVPRNSSIWNEIQRERAERTAGLAEIDTENLPNLAFTNHPDADRVMTALARLGVYQSATPPEL